MKRCRYCERELSRHEQFAGGVCGAPACRERAMQEELIAFRERALDSLDSQTRRSVPIAVVPHRAGRLVPLDPERRSAFEQHLREVAARTAVASDNSPRQSREEGTSPECEPETDTSARIATAVCSACSGFCCYPGGANAAFINVQTLQRYALAHAVSDPAQIIAAYLGHLPQHHFEGSCVYHTAAGCSLPRRMRSSTCNAYACKGLKDALASAGSERRFVVTRLDNRIMRGVLIDGEESRELIDTSRHHGDAPQGSGV